MRLFRRVPPMEEFVVNVTVYRDGDYVVAGKVDEGWIAHHKRMTVKAIRVQVDGMTTDGLRRLRVHAMAYLIDPNNLQPPAAAEEQEIAQAVVCWMSGDRSPRLVNAPAWL